jgi:hypothetical protein
MKIEKIHKATCHCGAVELELHLPNGLENPRRCDCSMCRRRGAIAASIKIDGLKVIKVQSYVYNYRFEGIFRDHRHNRLLPS